MKCVFIYFLFIVLIRSLQTQMTLSIVHLHGFHEKVKFDIEDDHDIPNASEKSYFINYMPKLVSYIKWIKNENKKNKTETLVLNTGSFTGARWTSNIDPKSLALLNQLQIDASVSVTTSFVYNQ